MNLLIIICTIIFICFIIFDLVPLFQQKKWKSCVAYIILACFAYVLHLFFLLGYKIPSPSKPIQKFVTVIFGLKN